MDFEPYQKHQLYKGYYEISEDGVVVVPDKCYWIVRKHQGNGDFALPDEPGQITLILNEDYKPELLSGFWSVISFLTEDEAINLAQQLIDAVSNTRRISINY